MMKIHLGVATAFYIEQKSTVKGEKLHHMIKKPVSGVDTAVTPVRNVKRERDTDIRLTRATAYISVSHHKPLIWIL